MKNWMKDRLSERSTYVGLSLLAGSFGMIVSPEQIQLIGAGVLAAVGVIESVRTETAK